MVLAQATRDGIMSSDWRVKTEGKWKSDPDDDYDGLKCVFTL